MYTAKIISREVVMVPGAILPQAWIGVEFYKDAVLIATETFKSSRPDTLDNWIKGQIKTYEDVDLVQEFISNLSLGNYDLTATEPTADEIKQRKYVENLQKLEALKKEADLGIIEHDDSEIISLVDTLKEARSQVDA